MNDRKHDNKQDSGQKKGRGDFALSRARFMTILKNVTKPVPKPTDQGKPEQGKEK